MLAQCLFIASMAALVTSQNVSLPCRGVNVSTELLPMRKCHGTRNPDGRVSFLCKFLAHLDRRKWFIPAVPQIMTMDEAVVTNRPVTTMRPGGDLGCVSLHSVLFKKWRDFPRNLYERYDDYGQFEPHEFIKYLKTFECQIDFRHPVPVGAINCTSLGDDGQCRFDVFGFRDMFDANKILNNLTVNGDNGLTILVELVHTWKLAYAEIKMVNVSFIDTVESILSVLMSAISFARIARIVFHQCNFKAIGFNGLPHMRYLLELDFVEAPIAEVHERAFDLVPDLRNVTFVKSRLGFIPTAIYSLRKIVKLVLLRTVSSLKEPFRLSQQSCKADSALRHLMLRHTVLGSLPNKAFCDFPSLVNLDVSYCGLSHINETPFYGLRALTELHLEFNFLTSLSSGVFDHLANLKTLNLTGNRINFLPGTRPFLPVRALEVLDLSGNELEYLIPETFANTTIRAITLSQKCIIKWTTPIFSTMPNLKRLDLEGNNIYTLDDLMFRDISAVEKVNVCKNPWDCGSCYLKNLQDFLRQSRGHCCDDCAVCDQPQASSNFSVLQVLWNVDQCSPPDFYVLVVLPLVLCALLLSVVLHLVYANRWYITYFALYLRVKVRGYKQMRHDNHFLWDAFVSYHSSEADWVRDVLLSEPETSAPSLRLCIAERDFVAGVPITENICDSIAHSRKSVFLLSREFCQSRWCMFEVSLAQHRLFEAERENNIVFLKKGQVPEDEMSPILNFLVKSRTYIAVPGEESDQGSWDMFWLQLKAALQS
ncbi:unnamed protein product [Ixodes hexagonus]